jgi:hypothetical protein
MKINPRFLGAVSSQTISILSVFFLVCSAPWAAAEPKDDSKVYWDGGKRGHVDGCSRLPKDKDELAKMKTATDGEMIAGGAVLCSRCPGSTTEGKGNPGGVSKNAKADKSEVPAV